MGGEALEVTSQRGPLPLADILHPHLFFILHSHSWWPSSPLPVTDQFSSTKGWPALFAGLKPCLAATAISQGVYFYLYSTLREMVAVSAGYRSCPL